MRSTPDVPALVVGSFEQGIADHRHKTSATGKAAQRSRKRQPRQQYASCAGAAEPVRFAKISHRRHLGRRPRPQVASIATSF
jgi:hypothetical protein